MTEKPIIFRGDMVRAILEGRKTQTRQVMKPQPSPDELSKDGSMALMLRQLPRYDIGDVLRVIEPWRPAWASNQWVNGPAIRYEADNALIAHARAIVFPECQRELETWWEPDTMPLWASRRSLCVTLIRAQRLQDISDDDIIAEGIGHPHGTELAYGHVTPAWNRRAMECTWRHIYGPDAWEQNSWVWAYTFDLSRRKPNGRGRLDGG